MREPEETPYSSGPKTPTLLVLTPVRAPRSCRGPGGLPA